MFIMPSSKKSLIVEQFQGNYLKQGERTTQHKNKQIFHLSQVQCTPFALQFPLESEALRVKVMWNVFYDI